MLCGQSVVERQTDTSDNYRGLITCSIGVTCAYAIEALRWQA